jgi:hypothetical protein
LLSRTAGFVPWLGPLVLALAVLASAGLMLRHVPSSARAHALRGASAPRLAAIAAVLAVLAGPAAYSIATVGRSLTGSNPLAGPAAVAQAGFGGGAPQRGQRPPQGAEGRAGAASFTARAGTGPPPGAGAVGGGAAGAPAGAMGSAVGKATISYLEAHQGTARYMLAAVGSTTAGAVALQSGRNVIDIGGFNGSDPSPSLSQLRQLVKSGQLHYVLLDSNRNGGGRFALSSSATRERDSWIESRGTAVKVAGEAGTGATLYYLPSTAA